MIKELLNEARRLKRFYVKYITSFAERIGAVTRRMLAGRCIYIIADSDKNQHGLLIRRALGEGRIESKVVPFESYSERSWQTPIVIFADETRAFPKRCAILQTQDLSDSIDEHYLNMLKDASAVLDYSTANIERLVAAGLSYKKLFYLPFEGSAWFYLARFLLATNHLSYSTFRKRTAPPPSIQKNERICLSLPETIERRRAFLGQSNRFGFFDGLRHKYAWVGCGMSYKYLCQTALDQGLEYLIVVEDDALLAEDFEKTLEVVLSYLAATPEPWDVFSGFIANLGENAEISAVVSHGGFDFVHINKLTSTVFNIYRRSIFSKLSKWNDQNYHFYTNTIDRYLGNWKQLKVITTLPFLVGHREDVVSSIWDFGNVRYNPMVAETIQRLSRLVQSFRSRA